MKICIISLGSYPLFNPSCRRTFGGSEVQLFLLSQEVSKNPSMDVHVVVGDFGQERTEKCGKITIHKGINIEKIKSFFAKLLSKEPSFFGKMLMNIRADIYIQRSANVGTGFICYIAHLLRKKFIYMTAHEIDCNGTFERQNSWLVGKLFQYGIRHADLIVTQSQEHADMIRVHHRRDSIVMPSLYSIPTEDELARVQKKHILWVGRCEDWKRPEVFIELAQLYPEEEFIMISPQSNNQSAYYTSIQDQLKHAPKNLRHIPYVPFAEIDQYFKEAKVFINTSTYEGFPNTFVQAMKNKTPILSLAVNPDGILEKAGCGIAVHNSILELHNKLNAYLSNTHLLHTHGKAGYRYAQRTHDSSTLSQRYIHLFEELLQTR